MVDDSWFSHFPYTGRSIVSTGIGFDRGVARPRSKLAYPLPVQTTSSRYEYRHPRVAVPGFCLETGLPLTNLKVLSFQKLSDDHPGRYKC